MKTASAGKECTRSRRPLRLSSTSPTTFPCPHGSVWAWKIVGRIKQNHSVSRRETKQMTNMTTSQDTHAQTLRAAGLPGIHGSRMQCNALMQMMDAPAHTTSVQARLPIMYESHACEGRVSHGKQLPNSQQTLHYTEPFVHPPRCLDICLYASVRMWWCHEAPPRVTDHNMAKPTAV